MKISTNFDRGTVITDVRDIHKLAKQRKSIYHHQWGLKAARAICNQQLWTLMKEVEKGTVYRTVRRK